MQSSNRRQFLRAAIGAGALINVGRASETPRPTETLHAEQIAFSIFGTKASLVAMHARPEVAREALRAAKAELETVEEVMSLYRPDSPICRLNPEKRLTAPHPYLVDAIRAAAAISARSQGAFDVTVQPLWALYAGAQRQGGLPDASDIRAACRRIDWRRVEVSCERITLHGDETEVTLNGIAQGFAADRAVAALRRHGIRHALVDAGEIGSLGDKGQGSPWIVGIQHPRREDAYVSVAKLAGRPLATSGDYATRFTDDRRMNHLFDPKTGRSPEAFASVSVAARTACQSDALATAVYVLGPARGLALVRATPGADALLVFKDGRTLATAGFPAEG